MTKKIVIQDLVKRHKGGKEQELFFDTTINFHIDDVVYSVSIEGENLKVRMVTTGFNNQMAVFPQIMNSILIK